MVILSQFHLLTLFRHYPLKTQLNSIHQSSTQQMIIFLLNLNNFNLNLNNLYLSHKTIFSRQLLLLLSPLQLKPLRFQIILSLRLRLRFQKIKTITTNHTNTKLYLSQHQCLSCQKSSLLEIIRLFLFCLENHKNILSQSYNQRIKLHCSLS